MNHITSLIPLFFIVNSAFAAEDHIRHHTAHQHGLVEVNIVQDNERLLFEIDAPSVDIVGFEHTPHSLREKNSVKNAINILEDASNIFDILPKSCQIENTEVQTSLRPNNNSEHHHEHGNEYSESHSQHTDFNIQYIYLCKKTTQMKNIKTDWFQHFPTTKYIQVNMMLDQHQQSLKLNKSSPLISLK